MTEEGKSPSRGCDLADILLEAANIINCINTLDINDSDILFNYFNKLTEKVVSCEIYNEKIFKIIGELGYLILVHGNLREQEKEKVCRISLDLLRKIEDSKILMKNYIKEVPDILHENVLLSLKEGCRY